MFRLPVVEQQPLLRDQLVRLASWQAQDPEHGALPQVLEHVVTRPHAGVRPYGRIPIRKIRLCPNRIQIFSLPRAFCAKNRLSLKPSPAPAFLTAAHSQNDAMNFEQKSHRISARHPASPQPSTGRRLIAHPGQVESSDSKDAAMTERLIPAGLSPDLFRLVSARGWWSGRAQTRNARGAGGAATRKPEILPTGRPGLMWVKTLTGRYEFARANACEPDVI